jgi:NAD(P)H-hydrate epimerase
MFKKVERVRRPPVLPRRRRDGHKGNYGHVLVVGGAMGMSGAVAMASQSALRGGAGLVTFAAPAPVQPVIAGLCPCATSIALSCDADCAPDPAAVRQVLKAAGACDVIAAGPGMGAGAGRQAIVRAVLAQDRPLVLDADGLNNLCAIDGWPQLRRCPMVLTPHPGEFSRLTGKKVAEIQTRRIECAVEAASTWLAAGPDAPLVLVLKGAGTVVTDARRVYVNTTGNPGMATGGSGDILTGLLAALIGQGLAPFEAACLGVYAHGLAGDLGAKALGEVSLTAWDLIDYLPPALKTVTGGRKSG